MTTTEEPRQRAYDQATAACNHDRHADGEKGAHELALELLLMLARNALWISDNNNIGLTTPLAKALNKLMMKLCLPTVFVWLQTKGKRSTFAHVQVMNIKATREAHLLSSATLVAIVARRQIA